MLDFWQFYYNASWRGFFQLTLVTFEFHELVYTNLFPDLGCSQPLLDADVPDDADPSPQNLPLWPQHTNTHGLQKSCGGKGTAWPLSQEESAQPLPWQAFIVFLDPLHQRWSSFTMQRFVLGGYLLQTKERMSLNTSKKDICNVKGEMVQTAMFHTWKV